MQQSQAAVLCPSTHLDTGDMTTFHQEPDESVAGGAWAGIQASAGIQGIDEEGQKTD